MEKTLLLLLVISFSFYNVNAQDTEGYKMTGFFTGGGRNVQITGTESAVFIEALLSKFPKK
jgi:hypothetical protein